MRRIVLSFLLPAAAASSLAVAQITPPPNGGGGGSVTISGTAGQIAATGAGCPAGGTGTCALSLVNGATNANAPGVSYTSGSVATVGGNCSNAAPCNWTVGNVTYRMTAGQTVTLSAGAGSGTAYVYGVSGGGIVVGHNLTAIDTVCSGGIVCTGGVTNFPVPAARFGTITATSDVWNSTGVTDWRAAVAVQNLGCGAGLTCSTSGDATTVALQNNGLGYNARGVYNAGTAYLQFDGVTYSVPSSSPDCTNGCTFVALQSNTGHAPPTPPATNAYWQVNAAAGPTGPAGAGYGGTSATSLTPGAGAVSLTTQTGLAWQPGQCVQVISSGAPTAYMVFPVATYTTATGVLTGTAAAASAGTCSGYGGSGAHTDWNLNAAGVVGGTGVGTTGPGYGGTSATSLTPGAGAVSLTTQTGLAWQSGQCVQIISAGTPTAYMVFPVTAYTSGTGVMTGTVAAASAGACSGYGGSGAYTDWNLNAAGVVGAAGSTGPTGGNTIYSSNGANTYNVPAGINRVFVRLWGAGGGGGGGTTNSKSNSGGGGGGYAESWLIVTPGGQVTVTVGAGGTGGQTSGANGVNGGNTTFGSQLTAYGGGGSYYGAAGAPGYSSMVAAPAFCVNGNSLITCNAGGNNGAGNAGRPDMGGAGGTLRNGTNAGEAGGAGGIGGGGGGGGAYATDSSSDAGGAGGAGGTQSGAGGAGAAIASGNPGACASGNAPAGGGGGGAANASTFSAGCSGANGRAEIYY
jgi:hypothetical protein